MKFFFFFITCLFTVGMFGQSVQNIELEWGAPVEFSSADFVKKAPNFKGASYEISVSVLPQYCNNIATQSWNLGTVDLQDITVESLTKEELDIIQSQTVEAEFKLEAQITGSNKNPEVVFCITPIRKNKVTGVFEKLISASVQYSALNGARKTQKTAAFKTQSVLANNNWYKVSVKKDNIYKITPSLINEMGLGSNVNINSIRVYGNGTGMLPENNAGFRYDDLVENAIEVVDQNMDGVFNGSDYALFYGREPHQWRFDGFTGNFTHEYNLYEESNYYFISVQAGNGKRISNANYGPLTPNQFVTSFDDHQFMEQDKVNTVGSGKRWFGDLYDFKLSYNYSFSVPNIETAQPVKIRTVAAGRSTVNGTYLNIAVNNTSVSNISFSKVPGSADSPYFSIGSSDVEYTANSGNLNISTTFNNNVNPTAIAWMDYIEVVARRKLVFTNGLLFRDGKSVGSGNVVTYSISSAPSSLNVWDVTDHLNPKLVALDFNGSSATFSAPADDLKQFAMVNGSNFPTPTLVSALPNQNLHGFKGVDMVIVSHPTFVSQAVRLATYHTNTKGLNVKVVTPAQIYNEFSSGGQDITAIKDFMRALYTNAASPQEAPKYLLLFGDATYDYKDRVVPNHNFVPIYESENSYSLYSSFSTDDFYGFLDPTEGNNMNVEKIDLGIGRFPVTTLAEAKTAVDKIIHYRSNASTFNDWRNDLLFVSDDVDNSWEVVLTQIPEQITKKLETDHPSFNLQKIYSDSYVQQSSAGSQRYPEARKELFRKVQSGNLITTYVGHGGEVGWATERILQLADVTGFDNINNMPLFTTITCEFSRLDDPLRVSAGEQLFLNKKGGAISLISTTRVVYVNPANTLVLALFDTIFSKVNQEYQTLGQVVMNTKNQVFQDVRLKFSLLGDPAMNLDIPEFNVVTQTVNGNPVGAVADTLKALSKVKIAGQVTDQNGNVLNSFNGVITPTIFDKKVKQTTLKNDGQGFAIPFDEFKNIIYKGKVAVVNGSFEYEFIVPLDISYNYGKGRISYYSTNETIDAKGNYNDIEVGGLNVNALADKKGPDIELYLNDKSFVNGGITGTDPVIYAVLSDSSGINTVGNGIGHDLVAYLDNDVNNTFVLNDYYEADLNSYQKGEIKYPLFDIEPGNHKITVRVWDVYNNPSEQEINFVVAEETDLTLKHVLNWPNPFTTVTEFQFEHNRASEPLDVQVQIFSVSGQLVKTINQQIQSTGNRVTGISWDGRDQYGSAIAKGVYIYKLRVKSTFDQSYAEKTEKLVILN